MRRPSMFVWGEVSIAAQVGAGVALDALAELVVVAGQDGVQHHTCQGGDGQAGQGDVGAAHGEGNAAGGGEAQPQTKMTAAMIRLRDLVRSTLFSTTLRTPTAEIIP